MDVKSMLSTRGQKRRKLSAGAAVAMVAALAVTFGAGGSAFALTGTATISAGSLAFVSAAPNVTFSATLNGVDQTVTSPQALDISDATGSGAGWDITATSTTFTAGAKTLATSSTTLTGAPTTACDAGAACTLATNSVTYPYTLPAAAVAPTATKLFNAALNTGLGNETATATWRLAVPAATFAGTYTSTWTLSLVSGP
jgi:WxL domain surface cell wall-binding